MTKNGELLSSKQFMSLVSTSSSFRSASIHPSSAGGLVVVRLEAARLGSLETWKATPVPSASSRSADLAPHARVVVRCLSPPENTLKSGN